MAAGEMTVVFGPPCQGRGLALRALARGYRDLEEENDGLRRERDAYRSVTELTEDTLDEVLTENERLREESRTMTRAYNNRFEAWIELDKEVKELRRAKAELLDEVEQLSDEVQNHREFVSQLLEETDGLRGYEPNYSILRCLLSKHGLAEYRHSTAENQGVRQT